MGSPPRRTISPETASEPMRMTALWLSVTFSPSTLSLSRSMWCSMFSTFVPLGGPISPETTNLPLLQASR